MLPRIRNFKIDPVAQAKAQVERDAENKAIVAKIEANRAEYEKQKAIENSQYSVDVLKIVPAELTKKEYEAACANFNVEKFDDVDCYAVKYFVISAPEYSNKAIIAYELARRHLKYLNGQKTTIKLFNYDYPAGKTLDCGHKVFYRSHEISASRGTVCSECYDRYSD